MGSEHSFAACKTNIGFLDHLRDERHPALELDRMEV
jgi:hypothetical protein